MPKPRDPTEAHAERREWLREQHMNVVCSVLRRLAVYAPQMLIHEAEQEIRASAVELVAAAARAGEHYAHSRPTEHRTPPDPDREPEHFDPDATPVITAQESIKRRRGR